MADRKVLKPAQPDLKVRLPEANRYLAQEGEEIELTMYWRRRIAEGDVLIVEPTPPAKPSKVNQE
jgi:hypothetical protein